MTVTILVHGFGYSTGDVDHDPRLSVFPAWASMLSGHAPRGFTWYSVPAGVSFVLSAWKAGYPTRYRQAWDLARLSGEMLFWRILGEDDGRPVNIICHSLGSRVVMQALHKPMGRKVANVIILNGAEHHEPAMKAALASPGTQFWNIVVDEDAALRIGAWASPRWGRHDTLGRTGLPGSPANWTDLRLDDPEFQKRCRAEGWDVKGDGSGVLDHAETYQHPGNWGLYRGLLTGWRPTLGFNQRRTL